VIPPPFVEGSDGRFGERIDRGQATLFPECLEDWIGRSIAPRGIFGRTEEAARRWVAAIMRKLRTTGGTEGDGACPSQTDRISGQRDYTHRSSLW
jgi:hypothetical protein